MPKSTVTKRVSTDAMAFYAPESLGKTRSITPEGFLVCENVPIARTGKQQYRDLEIPLDADEFGMIDVERPEDEVFRDETIASFAGKPITMEHPNDFVNPENWQQHEVGTVLNPRRGTGADKDLLIADLLIKDPMAIRHVNENLPEVSCGYNSDYEQTAPGKAIQRNIVGNHVALVDKGRAGPRCSIQDHSTSTGDIVMKVKGKVAKAFVNMLSGFQARDAEKMEAAAEELEDAMPEEEETKSLDARLRDAEEWIKDRRARDAAEEEAREKMKDAGEEEPLGKTTAEDDEEEMMDAVLSAESGAKNPDMFGKTWVGDSVAPTLKEILSRAEILAPGISIPVGDAVSHKAIKSLMVNALAKALTTDTGKDCVKPFLMGRNLASLDGRETLGVFNGAAELMRVQNNRAARTTGMKLATRDFGKPVSAADVQKQIEDWRKSAG